LKTDDQRVTERSRIRWEELADEHEQHVGVSDGSEEEYRDDHDQGNPVQSFDPNVIQRMVGDQVAVGCEDGERESEHTARGKVKELAREFKEKNARHQRGHDSRRMYDDRRRIDIQRRTHFLK